MIGRVPEGPRRMPCAVTRRAVLLGVGAGGISASVAGCGVRFEDDAPRIPLVPLRRPVPGEAALVALVDDTGQIAALTAAAGGPATGLPARLSKLHTRQAEVLQDALRRHDVPRSSGSRHPRRNSGGAHTSNRAAVAAIAVAEAAALRAPWTTGLAEVGRDFFTPVNALLAQRRAAAALLGKPLPASTATWPSPALAVPFLEASRAAVYGFQVVTAQIDAAGLAIASATLTELQAIEAEQSSVAAQAAPAPPLGYPLPFAVTTPLAARKLAAHVTTGLRGSVAAGLGSTVSQRRATPRVVAWLAAAEVLASLWGVPLAPFPGLG